MLVQTLPQLHQDLAILEMRRKKIIFFSPQIFCFDPAEDEMTQSN